MKNEEQTILVPYNNTPWNTVECVNSISTMEDELKRRIERIEKNIRKMKWQRNSHKQPVRRRRY